MTNEIKVGDTIYYKNYLNEIGGYCVVQKITGDKIWGVWKNTMEEAQKDLDSRLTYVKVNQCTRCDINWERELK